MRVRLGWFRGSLARAALTGRCPGRSRLPRVWRTSGGCRGRWRGPWLRSGLACLAARWLAARWLATHGLGTWGPGTRQALGLAARRALRWGVRRALGRSRGGSWPPRRDAPPRRIAPSSGSLRAGGLAWAGTSLWAGGPLWADGRHLHRLRLDRGRRLASRSAAGPVLRPRRRLGLGPLAPSLRLGCLGPLRPLGPLGRSRWLGRRRPRHGWRLGALRRSRPRLVELLLQPIESLGDVLDFLAMIAFRISGGLLVRGHDGLPCVLVRRRLSAGSPVAVKLLAQSYRGLGDLPNRAIVEPHRGAFPHPTLAADWVRCCAWSLRRPI